MFITKQGLAEKHKKQFFHNAYYGDFGDFFSPEIIKWGHQDRQCHPMLERVMNIVKSKKTDTKREFIPVVANYYEWITSVKLDYIIGSGVEIRGENEDFNDWINSKSLGLKKKVDKVFSEAISVGYCGMIPSYKNDVLGLEEFDFNRYYTENDNHYLYSTHQDKNSIQYVYLISIELIDGLWVIARRGFIKADEKDNTLGDQVPLSKIFPEIDEFEIIDKKRYKELPLFLVESHTSSKEDISDSIYRDVNSQIQLLIMYDIFTAIELQSHFFSSMVLPISFFQPDPREKDMRGLNNTQFIKDDGSGTARFLTKEIKEHYDVMMDHKKDLQKQIALATKIPSQVLMKDAGNNLRVQISKQDDRSLFLNSLQYQEKLVNLYNWVSSLYADYYNTDIGEYSFIPDQSFIVDDNETKETRLKQRVSGNLSLRDYLKLEFPESSTLQIEEMIQNIEDEKTASQQALTGDLISQI